MTPAPSVDTAIRPLGVLAFLAIVAAGVAVAGLLDTTRVNASGQSAPTSTQALQNRLASARSPYLRGAAKQPVAWQEWGPDAFALAATLGRPIWLDIGAVWCHWCHVMDRESYDDPQIAALINQDLVPIKVDRDERPDIDARYQAAHSALTGTGGGWPLTAFTTAEGEPFASATYVPPDTRGNQFGVRQLAQNLGNAYRADRAGALELARGGREKATAARLGQIAQGPVGPNVVRDITQRVRAAFDDRFGGFGVTEGPKFPDAPSIRLALAEAFLTENDDLRRKALQTLDAYARGGLRDHVNGGFFRYSVNRQLTVPHFEKMDYVQSTLLDAYLDAFHLTGDAGYADTARDILRYVNSTLSDPAAGGFFAHQDADISVDDDGSYYTWSASQATMVLSPDEWQVLGPYYDIQPKGEMESRSDQNVLRVVGSIPELARKLRMTEDAVRERIRQGLVKLRAARLAQRVPFVERTAFTDRNAMMISAYLHAYETLQDAAARDFALKTLDMLLARALRPDGELFHATSGTESYIPGFMLDYGLLADALLDAYQVTGRASHLRAAEQLTNRAIALFWDDRAGGFFDRRPEDKPLALLADRTKPFLDNPLPGENAVAARLLNRLYLITSDDRWRERAEKTLAAFAGVRGLTSFAGTYALTVEGYVRKPPQVVIIGPTDDPQTAELAAAARRTYRPGRMVFTFDASAATDESLPPAVSAAARVFANDRTPRAYVCVGETCAPPTALAADVVTLVRDYGRVGRR